MGRKKMFQERQRLPRAVVGDVLLRFDAVGEDDAAIRITLEPVDDLPGVDELRRKIGVMACVKLP